MKVVAYVEIDKENKIVKEKGDSGLFYYEYYDSKLKRVRSFGWREEQKAFYE